MNMLRSMKIGARLAGGFAAILLLMCALSAGVDISSTRNHAELLAAMDRAATQKSLAVELKDALLSGAVAIRNIGLQTTVDAVQREEAEAGAQRARFLKAMSQFDKAGSGADEQAVFERLRAIDREMSGHLKDAIGLATLFNTEQSAAIIVTRIDPLLVKARKEIEQFVQLQEARERASLDSANQRRVTFERVGMAIAAIVILLAAAGAWLLTASITVPLRAAVDAAGRVAQGDLSFRLEGSGRDEVGQLLVALSCMQQSLSDVIGEIAANALRVKESAKDMSSTANQISTSVQTQSDAVSGTASAVEEMTVSMAQVSDNADSARGVAAQTAQTAEEGKELVVGAAAEIDKIAESVTVTARTIRNLQESSQKISNIANVIREIADQTNLLALNAAIEAARAGEQGRGFAVVADEVRKLAERTGKSTSEIKEMIDSIQSQTDAAVKQMTLASERVDTGVTMIRNLQAPLEHLTVCSATAVTSLADLASAAHEQSGAATMISQNIERIAQMGEENTASAARSHTKAKDLDLMADGLQAVVNRFRR